MPYVSVGIKETKKRTMTGTKKLKLLVIGKSIILPCFTGIKILPREYAANKKAGITADLFGK